MPGDQTKQAYELALQLGQIFRRTGWKDVAYTKLAQWYRKVGNHYHSILNYFDNRNIYVAAESFNAKVKQFRRVFREIRDIYYAPRKVCPGVRKKEISIC